MFYVLIFVVAVINVGGSVRGGQVLGAYPSDLTTEGPLTLERGKVNLLCNSCCTMRKGN